MIGVGEVVLLRLPDQQELVVARVHKADRDGHRLILQADQVAVPDSKYKRLRYVFDELEPGELVSFAARSGKPQCLARVVRGYGSRLSLRNLTLQQSSRP